MKSSFFNYETIKLLITPSQGDFRVPKIEERFHYGPFLDVVLNEQWAVKTTWDYETHSHDVSFDGTLCRAKYDSKILNIKEYVQGLDSWGVFDSNSYTKDGRVDWEVGCVWC